jgi:hypothetical protein
VPSSAASAIAWFELRLHGLLALQRVEVLEEQQPGRLSGVVQLAGAAGILVQDVVDVLGGLFEHVLVENGAVVAATRVARSIH